MPNRLTLVEMAEQIRTRKLSPIELVEAHLRQIELKNPAINAFVRVFGDEARQQAFEAEKAVCGAGPVGPLCGVPVTIKDSFDIAGVPTTCGSRFFSALPARKDSTAVRRFKEAGAVILGKTNCPEFLANYETDNNIIGRTNNPWNLDRTPGGSSGGESAAIASFMSAGGIGSDGGGSIRIPAHFTGIAGLKPTPGRVSAAGHVPEIGHPGGLLGVAGPMARTAADVRLLFSVLSGWDPEDPFSAPVPLREAKPSGRIGVMEQFGSVPVQPAMRDAVRNAARALQSLGFAVEEFRPEGIERAPNLWWFFFGELPSRITQALIAGREDEAHWTGTEFLNRALKEPEPSSAKVLDSLEARDKMRSHFLRQMEPYSALLLPPCGVPAFKHRERRWKTPEKSIGLFEAMMPVTPFNLMGMPGMVIPWSMTEDGLPVGIQLAGRPWDEETLLELAVRMEEARGPFNRPPGY
jgi:Asp-tRNA(Asn)/Glu-tRNA(Gln) amidotransferase A subunit family amidase